MSKNPFDVDSNTERIAFALVALFCMLGVFGIVISKLRTEDVKQPDRVQMAK